MNLFTPPNLPHLGHRLFLSLAINTSPHAVGVSVLLHPSDVGLKDVEVDQQSGRIQLLGQDPNRELDIRSRTGASRPAPAAPPIAAPGSSSGARSRIRSTVVGDRGSDPARASRSRSPVSA